MLVFAWILWVAFLVMLGITLISITCGIIAMGEGRTVKIKVNVLSVLFEIATFVFLSIYIFS